MALADTAIERTLQVDGVQRSGDVRCRRGHAAERRHLGAVGRRRRAAPQRVDIVLGPRLRGQIDVSAYASTAIPISARSSTGCAPTATSSRSPPPVDANLEVAEIHRRVIAAGGPALLFTNVKGAAFPLVTNLFGTARRAELAFGTRPLQLIERLVHLAETLLPPTPAKLWAARDLAWQARAHRPVAPRRAARSSTS